MDLVSRVNSDSEISALSISSTTEKQFSGIVPITATPAALAGGVAAGAALVGAAAAGAALGEATD